MKNKARSLSAKNNLNPSPPSYKYDITGCRQQRRVAAKRQSKKLSENTKNLVNADKKKNL